jgi:hypothetical protein
MAFQLQTGIKTLNPVLLHEWAGPYSGANETAAKAAANAAIPSAVRLVGLEVTLVIAGVPKKYWYGTGVNNGDLVPMSAASSLNIKDEGTSVTSAATSINFQGDYVSATASGTDVTVTIANGSVNTVTGLNTDNTDPHNPVVQISVDGSTITGDGTPGNPLVASGGGGGGGHTNFINLSSADYTITAGGTYYVFRGSDPNNTYHIEFDSTLAEGTKITIVNKDITDFFAAKIDPFHGEPIPILFQGGIEGVNNQSPGPSVYGHVTNIPSGMTYTFELIGANPNQNIFDPYWMCHPNNIEPYYDGIVLYDSTNNTNYPLFIHNHGTYNIIRGTVNKGAVITLPDPSQNIGKKITITTLSREPVEFDSNYPELFPSFAGFSPANSDGKINQLPGGSIYTFMAVTNAEYEQAYWLCTYSYPTALPFIYMDLSMGNYIINTVGIYKTDYTGSNYPILPDPGAFTGKTIKIIYDATSYSFLDIVWNDGGSNHSILDGNGFTTLYNLGKGIHNITSIGYNWVRESYS